MARCLALFSGGLDSILACKVIQQQGIEVIAIKFISPFFDYHLLAKEAAYREEMKKKYDISVQLHDISTEFLAMLADPAHGYGKNFNPCVDCKILIISTARQMMARLGATFLITGEVVGQRPMSQRKDTLRIIERDAQCDDILLRPLCAHSQKPTAVERDGIVDRDQLPRFSGRNRTPQMELAARLGITDYPDPAGGCILTEEHRSKRIAHIYRRDHRVPSPADILFLLQGRQFRLPRGSWLALGRNQQENKRIADLAADDDYLVQMSTVPGPLGLLRYCHHEEDKQTAAALVARYAKKSVPPDALREVSISGQGRQQIISAAPVDDTSLGRLVFPAG